MGGVPLHFNGMRDSSVVAGLEDLVKDKAHKEIALAALAYIRHLKAARQSEANWGRR